MGDMGPDIQYICPQVSAPFDCVLLLGHLGHHVWVSSADFLANSSPGVGSY